MGINIGVETVLGKSHPDWDDYRHVGDRDIPSVVEEAGELQFTAEPGDAPRYRPKDIEAFRAAMIARHPYNSERWNQLTDILKDGKWWLYYGY